jgi:phenylalanyl-tRNA synthetase alpha chain
MISEGEAKLLEKLVEDKWTNAKELLGKEDISVVMSTISWLEKKSLVEVKDNLIKNYSLTEEGKRYLNEGLPERRVFDMLEETDRIRMKDVPPNVLRISVIWLKKFGAKIENGAIIIEDKPRVNERIREHEEALKHVKNLKEKDKVKNLLRRGLIKERESIERFAKINDKGSEALKDYKEKGKMVTKITKEVIERWQDYHFKEYDVKMPVRATSFGRKHPLRTVIDEIREIFFSMGFEEIRGNFVESSFWDMDALFVPQQHPARDLQDTFYLKRPSKIKIDNKEYAKRVKLIHEDGGDTGSKGWQYGWSYEEAERALLRTHTTVSSIRYAYKNREKESFKAFTIGRIFRRENPDPTHLPEFTQIDGVLSEKDASLAMLIGILKHFYAEMGFKNIRVKPSYFPYTEPSLEVDVYYDGNWLELGGSGVFRSEVTHPLGIVNPVLAWGLGVERLAMLRHNLKTMKELYVRDLEWIKSCKLI